MGRKRQQSFSLSEDLIIKLKKLWFEEVQKQINKNEVSSFSQFVEKLLWESIKSLKK